MKRVYHHYTKWEDYKNGMFINLKSEELIESSMKLLSQKDLLYFAMVRVINEWKYSTEMNLSNMSRNRRAWLGQAACNLIFGVPENLTKQGWNRLSEDKMIQANFVADMVIREWELKNKYGDGK